jgi:hypothetical protein
VKPATHRSVNVHTAGPTSHHRTLEHHRASNQCISASRVPGNAFDDRDRALQPRCGAGVAPHVDATIATAKRDGYKRAASLPAELGTYYDRLGRSEEFADCARAMRKANSRRRNVLTAFDTAGLPR